MDTVTVRVQATNVGKEIGLTGQDLVDFVKEAVADAKMELAEAKKEAAAAKKEREAESARKEREADAERQHELEKLKLDNEKLKLDNDHAEKMAELEGIQNDQEGHPSNPFSGLFGPQIQLPKFNDEKDSFDAFVARFESVARSQKWPTEQWAIYLSSLLSGKALEVVHRMKVEDSMSFEKVKEELLRKFRHTKEGFRLRFRTVKPEKGEMPDQFVTKIANYCDRWIELSKVEQTYEGLRNLIICEQFMNCCGKEMLPYLKEKECITVEQVMKWSRTYVQAHGLHSFTDGVRSSQGRDFKNNGSLQKHNQGKTYPVNASSQKSHQSNLLSKSGQGQAGRTDGKRQGKVSCYICAGNHYARDCSQRASQKANVAQALVPVTDPPCTSNDRKLDISKGQWVWLPEVPRIHENYETNSKSEKESTSDSMCGLVEISIEGNGEYAEMDSNVSIGQNSEGGLHKLGMAYDNVGAMFKRMPIVSGRLYPGNTPVSVLRDSGCSACVIRADLVSPKQMTGKNQSVVLIDGTVRRFPVAKVKIDSPYLVDEIEALCIPNSLSEVVIGNVEGARDPSDPDWKWQPKVDKSSTGEIKVHSVSESCKDTVVGTDTKSLVNHESESTEEAMAVQTRSQTKQAKGTLKPLKVVDSIPEVTPTELSMAQKDDPSLKHLWEKVESRGESSKYIFVIEKGWLCRQLRDRNNIEKGCGPKVLVVPTKYRSHIMKIAHESLLQGHLGVNNTLRKIQSQFYWPGIADCVSRYCKSCDLCQKTIDKGRVKKVPLGRMPQIGVPFERIAIDLVGPLSPPSERGHRYILTVVDYATRYLEAIPFKQITTPDIAEALIGVYSRVGIPCEVLSDLGTQFISDLMREVSRLLSIKQLTSTRYHPICNGLVERNNGVIKKILRKMCAEQPRQWDRFLPALLFALREIPSSSLGYSPFQLLYGREVRGPLSILREIWTNENVKTEAKTEYNYVIELRERLEETWELARKSLLEMSERYRKYYDAKAKPRKLKVNDKVLVLLPSDQSKLLVQWQGPYTVVDTKHENNYVVDVRGNLKLFHINLLKQYFERDESTGITGCFEVAEALMEEEKEATNEVEQDEICEEGLVHMPSVTQKEFVENIRVNSDLETKESDEIKKLLCRYQDVFTDVPKKTTVMTCKIFLTTDEPIHSKPYMVPQALRETIKQETEAMLKLGIIERSDSPYGHPIVIVKKADGSNRFCIDFRRLNKVMVFDPEPIPNPQDLFASLSKSCWFTKLDLMKGFWQIPMEECDKEKTAFLTPDGKFHFCYMPFGMVTATAQFSRLMRKVLVGMSNVVNFIDDILIHNSDWESHIRTIEMVLNRLRKANLAARPSKCMVAYRSLEFLGREISKGVIRTNPTLRKKIMEAPRPVTKKQVRSFLGLTGFYRDFIPNYSDVALPLTMLTRKGSPDKVSWGLEQEKAFGLLKHSMDNPPILHMPDFEKMFILQVDASDTGLGAILLQNFNGENFPIAYASKKLLPREKNYATIEKECLSIVWAVKKFEYYLVGRMFEIHTDHKPLLYIDAKKFLNKRIMRWSLVLQEFRFRLVAVKGRDNVGADFLSRENQ